MKNILVVLLLFFTALVSAADFTTSGKILVGGTALKNTWDASYDESEIEFGALYGMGDFVLSSDKITVGGKIYYRIKESDDSKDVDTDETMAQKLDVHRAYLRYRPFGDKLLEVSIGKLYSYYLTGNYFSIAEIYTGSSRWGKTGVGAKSQYAGFTFGAALPVTESYVEFKNARAGFGAIEYNFAHLYDNIPISVGFSLGTEHTVTEKKNKTAVETTHDDEIFWTASVNYAPKLDGFISKLNATLSFSYNSAPFVANSVYKNIVNYNAANLSQSHFASLNFRANLGKVQCIAEGEAGHSAQGTMIPLYIGTQFLLPIIAHVSIKPRFCYYAALDDADADNSRNSIGISPRLWITAGQWAFSAGADFLNKQVTKHDRKWEWSIPFYGEYKIGK